MAAQQRTPTAGLRYGVAPHKVLTRQATIRYLDIWEHALDLLFNVPSDFPKHTVPGLEGSCILGAVLWLELQGQGIWPDRVIGLGKVKLGEEQGSTSLPGV